MNTYTTAQQHAVKFIRRLGHELLERDIDAHIDLVTWDRRADQIVFVEVVERKEPPEAERTKWKPLYQQRKAIRNWLRVNRWGGAYRFDVIEVHGTKKPVIDHTKNVSLKK